MEKELRKKKLYFPQFKCIKEENILGIQILFLIHNFVCENLVP